jgi:hypothetical protein
MQDETTKQLTPEEEERAADDRSRAMKRQMAESVFSELFWPVKQVLLWIAFRDIDRLLEDNFLQAMFGAKMYGRASVRDANPRKTLLRAVQDGSLAAIRDGAELRREAWAEAIERRWPPDVRFRREDVLRLWPDASAGASAQYGPRLVPQRKRGEALDQAIREAIQTAINRQADRGGKKLNGKEQVGEAMKILRAQGVEAPALKKRVEKIADDKFKQYRNSIGVTLKSQLVPKS